jgi:inosine-uridine nucleoside N-ribohydrolase
MTTPPVIILDTDMGNDIDDALALVMVHELQRMGECSLAGITISKENPWAAAFTRLVNARCGNPDIPIGVVRNGATPEDGPFIRKIAEPYGQPTECEDAIRLLRKLLRDQPDHSVVLVTIGFFTNVAHLLASDSDDISPLGGRKLVERKVRFVSSMAGNFSHEAASGPDLGNPEFNVRTDIPAARHFVNECPAPIIFSAFEIGSAILFPGALIDEILAIEPGNPVAAGYAAYLQMPYDRQTWDQTAVLYAVRPGERYFDLSAPGVVRIDDQGFTEFAPRPGGLHRHLILREDRSQQVRDTIAELSIRFPHLVS